MILIRRVEMLEDSLSIFPAQMIQDRFMPTLTQSGALPSLKL